jgi:hypothetical protein
MKVCFLSTTYPEDGARDAGFKCLYDEPLSRVSPKEEALPLTMYV